MSSFDFEAADPHVVKKSPKETDGDFVRFESTLYPGSSQDSSRVDFPHERWSLDYKIKHVHPTQKERWEVVAGELGVTVDGDEQMLTAGEEVTLPAGVPHQHWNPAKEPARVIWERHPAYSDPEWAESLYTLAQRGQTDEDGVPNLLQLAVINSAYPNECVYLPSVPVRIQKIAFSALGAIGRLLGYKARHSRRKGTNHQ